MARRNTISNDIFNEYLNAIDEGLNPPQKPAAPATVGMGDLRVADKEPTIDPVQSFSDFRKLERDSRVPVAGLDYEIPQAPYQAQFDHLKNLSDPTMATGTESEWWNPVTPEKQPIVATSFSRAVYNTAAGMAGGLRMLGAEDTGKAIADKLDGIASSLPQTDGELALSKKKTEFSDALTPEFYTDGRATAILSSAAGASFAFMVGSALVATVVPASATAWTTAKISALGRAALSTPAGRATLGKIVQNPKVQQIYANTLGKIGDYGKAYILTRTAASAPESLTEGGGSYNTMMRWNEDVAIIKNPNISAAEKTEAKSRIRQIYQQEGGQGEPNFDHLPTIDDAKIRAWKQTMANLPLLVSSNALEGVNLFTPAKGLVLGTARKGITNSLIQGGEELGQSAIETGISGVGTHGTPVQGEGFVWSLNPAEWSSETKQNVMGGLGFGLATGGVGGQSKVKLKNGQVVTEKVEPGVINKIFNKQPNEQAEPVQPAAQPEQTKLKIGDTLFVDGFGDIILSTVRQDGTAVFVDSNRNVVAEISDMTENELDPSVFQTTPGTAPIAPENNPAPANPGAKPLEASNVNGSVSLQGVQVGPATWHSKDGDISVNITGLAGEKDGVQYVSVEGSSTAIPLNEISPLNINPEKHEVDPAPVLAPNKNWKIDPGAMPGEPEMFLGVKDGDFETATAAIRQVVDDQGKALWESMLGDGTVVGQFSSSAEAAAAAEKAMQNVPTNISPKEQSAFAVGDKVTSSKGAGVVSIVTKTGIGVKTADGKKFSVSWDNVEKFGLKKEDSSDGVPASGKSSVSTGTSVDILNDIAAGKSGKIKIGDTVTRPGKVVKTQQGGTIKTGKKGVVKSGSAADVATVDPNQKQKDAFATASRSFEEASKLSEQAKTDSSIENPWPEVIELLKETLHAQNVGDARIDEQARKMMREAEKAAAAFGSEPEPVEAAKHSAGDKVTVSGEQGEATVTSVQGDNVVVEMDTVGVTGTKTTTIPAKEDAPVGKVQSASASREPERGEKVKATISGDTVTVTITSKQPHEMIPEGLNGKITFSLKEWSDIGNGKGNPHYHRSQFMDAKLRAIFPQQYEEYSALMERVKDSGIYATDDAIKKIGAADNVTGKPTARPKAKPAPITGDQPALIGNGEYFSASNGTVYHVSRNTSTPTYNGVAGNPVDLFSVARKMPSDKSFKPMSAQSHSFEAAHSFIVGTAKSEGATITGQFTTMPAAEKPAVKPGEAVTPTLDKNEEKSDNVVENNNGFDERSLASVKDTIKSFSKFKKPVNVIDSSPEAIAAYEREMKAELDKLGANIVFNPSLMGAALKLGIAHAQNGVNNFAEWSAKMISSVGEKIRPYLPSTWQMINTFPEGETYNPVLVGALFEYAGIKSQTGVNGYDALRKSISEDFGAEFEPYAKMVYAGITSWKEAATSEHRSEGATDNRLPEAVPPEETEGRRSTGDNKADSDTAGENLGNNNEPASGTAASPETRPDAEVSARPEHGQRGSAKPNVGKRKAGVRNQNYVITDKDQLGKGGPVQKFNDNIAAIKLIKKLNEENRQATPEEKAVLVRYVGWGGFPQLFDSYLRPDSDWYSRSKELKELLSSEEYTAARASTTNAHYTSETVVRAIWDGVKRLGFTGGKVLEPSMGTGNFFGMIPKEFQNSSLTGVELDPLTGAIAKQLYQDASVHVTGFEKAPLPEEYYDLAISNVPFGDYTLHDPKYNKYKLNIHNYFFVKALDKVRPGGLVVFVTGTGTMQSDRQKAVRSMIAGKAELLGAIKMPNTAFKENARTEVTTDVLFLRKLMPDEAPAGHAWGELAETGIRSTYNYRDMQVNEYFVKNPDMMLGELYEDKLHPGRLGLKDNGKDLGDMMKKAIAKLPKGIYAQSAVKTPTVMDISKMIDAPGTAREGSVQIQDGKVHIVTSGKMAPKDLDAKRVKAVSAIVSIREQVRELMRAQLDPSTSDDVLTHRRATLKKSYEQYVKEHGYLAASKNKSLFDDDPDSGLVFALEQYPDKKSAPVLSDIFTTRTIQPYRRATEVSTPEEALIASLQETGRVDIERMSALLSKPEEAIIQELEGQIFHDPTSGKWEQRELYLSGNVRQKLVAAKEAAKTDKKYSINVSELDSVQPADLEPHEIKAKLGSPWIPASDIEKFIDYIVGTNNFVSVKHDDLSNTWLFNESNVRSRQRPDNTRNYQTWGTSRYSAVDLIEAILNSRQITVKDKDIDGKPYVNDKETAAAQDKAENIKKEFNEWVWKDKERSERLAREYNDNFNAVRLPEYNGEHLQIPGLTTRIELRPHQKNAIWRIIQGGNSLIAHGVGLGKTLVMQAAGMKLRQLGLSRKPLYVLPNATISDFETKFREHFPAAKILVLSSKTLPPEVAVMKKESGPTTKTTKEGVILERYDVIKNAGPVKPAIDNAKTAERIQARRAILSRIATEDWDAVLITHNMFTRLPMSPRIMAEHIKQIISDYYAAIESAKAESGNSKWVKDLEKQVKRWEAELEAALSADTKSIVTPFDELGIDYLFVDEADVFKNLGFATKMGRIAGVQNGNAKRSFDMYAKTSYLNKANRGSGVVFATGTPISNTIGEMFTMMRYLIPQRLRELNIGHFDTWAANFGETIASFERDVAGKGYRTVERFAKFVNAPELIRLFREFADVKRAEDVNLPLPILRTGSWQTVVSPMSDALKNYIDTDITSRVNAIRSGAVKPDDDNMLVVTSDLRKAALDIRLVLPGVRLAADSKINKAVDNIFRIWSETKEKRSTQIVFCDLSIPKAEKEEVLEEIESDDFEIEAVDASVYQTIQRMLIDKGVPKEEIVFIHDAKNNKQKQALFDKMNSGEIRVLIGSTGKAGVGLNVQKKLVAAHHLDVPWRPRDLEQRNGRIVRQGNENEEVDVFAYATEGSADSLMWERVAMKQRFIQHAMSDNLTDREIVEDDLALGFAEISAITSGNPLLAEKVKLENQVTRLRLLREKHESDKLGYRIKLERTLPHDIKKAREGIAKVEKDIAARKDTSGDKFSVEINGKAFTDRKAAEDALNGFIEENTYSAKSGDESVSFVSPDMIDKEIGFIGGMRIITRKTGDDHHMYTITKKTGESLEVQKGQIRLVLKGPSARTYPVTTPTVNGIENRLRRIDDFLKEAQTELNNLESSKAEIQKLIDKPFDREAEYQKLNSRLDDVLKELAETDKPKETDVQLNFGIDPFQLIPGLRKYSDMTVKEAVADLVAIGRKVYAETTHGGKWMARMKELLGDVWAKAKSVITKVWNQVKATVGENRGSVRISSGTSSLGFFSATQRAIEAMDFKVMPAKDLSNRITKTPGIKQEELDDLGLIDWIKGKDGKVTKEEVLAFVEAGGPKIEELTKGEGKTAFAQYQIPGGENYREVLLTLPDKKSIPFTSSHWDEKNVLAHFRLNDRTVDGKKVLFIEEIQSDWHQKGKKEGYGGLTESEQKEFDALTQKIEKALLSSEENTRWSDLKKKKNGHTGVPDAPFKSTPAWSMLAFKRVLRMAVEQGYDSVAWTPGDVQAERYDLSKQVSEIAYWDEGSGNYGVSVLDLNGSAIQGFDARTLSAKELEANLGKEIADRIVNDKGEGNPEVSEFVNKKTGKLEDGVRVLQEDNLRVGGDGMKGFYDRILLSEVGKYLKKLDKDVRVGTIKLLSESLDYEDTRDAYTGDKDVWSIPITGKVHAEVMRGQALYAGIDPTLIASIAKEIAVAIKERVYPLLVKMGTNVYLSGKQTYSEWVQAMRSALGNQWGKLATQMKAVWNEVKKAVSNNRGAIRLGGREIEAKRVYVPPGANQTLAKALEADGWQKRVAADGTTVLKKPEPQEKDIPDSFVPPIPGMDREVAFEFEQSRSKPELPTGEAIKEKLKAALAYAKRKYVTLPRTEQFAPLEFALTQLEHKKGVATDKAVRIIEDITKTLKNPRDYQIFSHKVVFDDIAADLEANENYEMPFGLTKENFQANYDAVNAAVTPNVQAAIDARKEAWGEFKKEYIKNMKAIDFDVEKRLTKGDTYFHHIVLDYAELKRRMDPVLGSKLRTPSYRGFLKNREGSTKNILTDYLEPEMEVMGQMMYDVEIAKTIALVQKKYDIQHDLKRIAALTNEQNAISSLIEELGDEEGEKAWRSLSKKQAMAITRLGEMAFNDELPNNGKWDDVLDALVEMHNEKGQQDPDDEAPVQPQMELSKDRFFGYLNYLMHTDDAAAKMTAGLMFKGISEKAKAIKAQLGKEHVTWRDLIPEGYEAWQPREGNLFFSGYTIPEHIAQALADKAVQEIGVPADKVRRVLLQGGKRREMVVPVEVASTLEDISPAKHLHGTIVSGMRWTLGKWKQAVLTMPTRFMTYNFNNLTGDVDAAIAGQGHKFLRKTGTAMKEAYGVFYKGKEMSQDMRDWFERGGFETLLQTQEAGKISHLSLFDRFMEKQDGMHKIKHFPQKVWNSYWHAARKATDFRESILRYAKYLDYLEQMQQNNGTPSEFGASDPKQVMALDDIKDRAFKLSNELLGAYDSISAMGQDIRATWIPFWSWKEVNLRRYTQLVQNATIDNQSAAAVGAAIGGLALRKAPFALIGLGKFAIKATFLMALLQGYNWWVWPEEERDLGENEQQKMHIILGRDADGKVRYVKASGAFADILGWVNLDTPYALYDSWLSGRKSIKDIGLDMAKSPVNIVASSITPYLKAAYELTSGKSIYPDVFRQRPIRDKGLYLASSIALGEEYRAVFGLPHRPYDASHMLLVRKSDPLQAAYYSFMGTKQKFMESKGKGKGFFNSPESEALRNYKEALRYQDEQSAVKYLELYKQAGGTKEGLERSLESMNPTAGLTVAEKKEFIASLGPEQRRKMDMAQQYFDMVIARSGGALSVTKKGVVDVKVKGTDLPSEKKPKKQNFF